MSDKTLKIQRAFVWAIYQGLRNTPPKEFQTVEEIKTTMSGVLPSLKEHIESYLALYARAKDWAEKIATKEVASEVAQPEIDKVNLEWSANNRENGKEVVEVKLSEEALKVLSEQFNRDSWGRTWISLLEEFGEVLAAFEEAKK